MLLRFHHFRHPWRSHVVARCVRRAWLCGVDEYAGKDYSHRKGWVVDRLTELSSIFAIDLCAFAVPSSGFCAWLKEYAGSSRDRVRLIGEARRRARDRSPAAAIERENNRV